MQKIKLMNMYLKLCEKGIDVNLNPAHGITRFKLVVNELYNLISRSEK